MFFKQETSTSSILFILLSEIYCCPLRATIAYIVHPLPGGILKSAIKCRKNTKIFIQKLGTSMPTIQTAQFNPLRDFLFSTLPHQIRPPGTVTLPGQTPPAGSSCSSDTAGWCRSARQDRLRNRPMQSWEKLALCGGRFRGKIRFSK